MSDLSKELVEPLAAFGTDFSRWPEDRAAAARRALLGEPEFRRAWDDARVLDAKLAGERDAMDLAVRRSGALARLSRRTLAQLDPDPLAGLRWERIAAALMVAALLGGATDLLLPKADSPDVVMLDPLEVVTAELR
jgi:hypothetical protein